MGYQDVSIFELYIAVLSEKLEALIGVSQYQLKLFIPHFFLIITKALFKMYIPVYLTPLFRFHLTPLFRSFAP